MGLDATLEVQVLIKEWCQLLKGECAAQAGLGLQASQAKVWARTGHQHAPCQLLRTKGTGRFVPPGETFTDGIG